MRKEVVARPEAGVPAVDVLRERVDAGAERGRGVGVVERHADVAQPPQAEDRPVEDQRRRLRRVLLGKRPAAKHSGSAARVALDGQRTEGAPRRLGIPVLARLEMHADEQARTLALRHAGHPRGR